MSNIGRQREWDPWRQDITRRERSVERSTGTRPGARVLPSIIISNREDNLFIRAELPGIRLQDLDIAVSGDMLTLQGTRMTGEGLEGGWYHRRERESGGFSRAIRLPAEVEGERAEATYTAGVLTITLPLRQEAKPKQIRINVAEG